MGSPSRGLETRTTATSVIDTRNGKKPLGSIRRCKKNKNLANVATYLFIIRFVDLMVDCTALEDFDTKDGYILY